MPNFQYCHVPTRENWKYKTETARALFCLQRLTRNRLSSTVQILLAKSFEAAKRYEPCQHKINLKLLLQVNMQIKLKVLPVNH